MNILEYSWNTLATIAGLDYDAVSLVLDPTIPRPMVGLRGDGYVVKLPVPKAEGRGVYSLQGLYADAEDQNWLTLWRLYRASLYHAALHLVSPPGRGYSPWAKEKDVYPSVFTVSLLEDYRVTNAARVKWGGLMGDLAFANYVGSRRLGEPDKIASDCLRFASKLLLSVWGVADLTGRRKEEDNRVLNVTERVRGLLESEPGKPPQSKEMIKAADLVYSELQARGHLFQIPSFPHTEAHSPDSVFSSTLLEGGSAATQIRALQALGVAVERQADESELVESREAFQAMEDSRVNTSRIIEKYQRMVDATRLKGFELPAGDYSSYMKTRAGLAGAIRNIRNQLMQVKTVLDEDPGKESGQVDMQMAMQIVASGQQRSDAFVRDEPLLKDEAWAILLDASKSLRSASLEVKGVATCLAEVAKDLMTEKGRWALFAFNDKFQVLKDFDELYTLDHRARIGGLRQEGPTYLPDALEVAAKALSLRPVEAKYLVVVSDCLPTGYEGIEEELASVASGLGKKGVMMVGLGVQSSAVRRYFRVNSVLMTHYEMMKTFVKAYLELSAAA